MWFTKATEPTRVGKRSRDSWDSRRVALASLIEIRLMFIDELAIEFRFEECADLSEAEDGDREFEFEFEFA